MNNSIVMQLQEKSLDTQCKVSDLLLKAKTIAIKLEQNEALAWIESELKGYKKNGIIPPDYRNINCVIQFYNDFRHIWQTLPFGSDAKEIQKSLSSELIINPIIAIESMIAQHSDFVYCTIDEDITNIMRDLCNSHDAVFRRMISSSEFENIIYQTKSKILDWTLELEKAGVLGEGFSFSTQEKKDAIMPTQQIFHGNTNIINGDVAGNGSIAIHQSSNFTIEQINDLLQQIEGNLAALPESCKQPITNEIEQIKHEITSGTHDKSKIRKSLESIKKISESAAGNLVASGIKEMISALL
jgi:hypothetical protein